MVIPNQALNKSQSQVQTNIRNSTVIKDKFKHKNHLLNQLVASYVDEQELYELKVEGENLLEKEKNAIKTIRAKRK